MGIRHDIDTGSVQDRRAYSNIFNRRPARRRIHERARGETLVGNECTEHGWVEVLGHLVVRDPHPRAGDFGPMPHVAHVHPDLVRLSNGLAGDGQRGQHERRVSRQASPFELLDALAQPAILEQRRTTLPDRPPDDLGLPVVEEGVNVRDGNGASDALNHSPLTGEELTVGGQSTISEASTGPLADRGAGSPNSTSARSWSITMLQVSALGALPARAVLIPACWAARRRKDSGASAMPLSSQRRAGCWVSRAEAIFVALAWRAAAA